MQERHQYLTKYCIEQVHYKRKTNKGNKIKQENKMRDKAFLLNHILQLYPKKLIAFFYEINFLKKEKFIMKNTKLRLRLHILVFMDMQFLQNSIINEEVIFFIIL